MGEVVLIACEVLAGSAAGPGLNIFRVAVAHCGSESEFVGIGDVVVSKGGGDQKGENED